MIKKMTNAELVSRVNAIREMQEREAGSKEKLFGNKIKANYALKKNKELFTNLLKPYEESLKDLVAECCSEEGVKDNKIIVKNECVQRWNSAITELLKIEMDVDVCTVKIDDLDGLSMSMTDMETIDFMIED